MLSNFDCNYPIYANEQITCHGCNQSLLLKERGITSFVVHAFLYKKHIYEKLLPLHSIYFFLHWYFLITLLFLRFHILYGNGYAVYKSSIKHVCTQFTKTLHFCRLLSNVPTHCRIRIRSKCWNCLLFWFDNHGK